MKLCLSYREWPSGGSISFCDSSGPILTSTGEQSNFEGTNHPVLDGIILYIIRWCRWYYAHLHTNRFWAQMDPRLTYVRFWGRLLRVWGWIDLRPTYTDIMLHLWAWGSHVSPTEISSSICVPGFLGRLITIFVLKPIKGLHVWKFGPIFESYIVLTCYSQDYHSAYTIQDFSGRWARLWCQNQYEAYIYMDYGSFVGQTGAPYHPQKYYSAYVFWGFLWR